MGNIVQTQNKMLLIGVGSVLIIAVVLIKSSSRIQKLPVIDNGIIDEEHNDIDLAFDHLLKTVKKHWNTEDKLFEKGFEKMPENHSSVRKQIEEHKQAHAASIAAIETMRGSIHKHIKEYDVPHFHWLSHN